MMSLLHCTHIELIKVYDKLMNGNFSGNSNDAFPERPLIFRILLLRKSMEDYFHKKNTMKHFPKWDSFRKVK